MFGSSVLEVAIGVVFVYFIISILCSTITEWISRMLAMRSRTLKDGIKQLLNQDDGLKNAIYNHPLIQGLSPKDKWWIFKKKEHGPSEIPPRTFALALFDIITGAGAKDLQVTPQRMIDNLETSIDSFIGGEDTKQVLRTLVKAVKAKTTGVADTIKEFQSSIETWFDDSMQRVTGWYKRKTQLIVLVLALAVCFSLNVDTFGIANSFLKDDALRASIVAAAESQIAASSSANISELKYNDELTKLNIPIGWTRDTKTANSVPVDARGWLLKIAGILATTMAVSLGAAFWFDMLGKLVNLRAAGNKTAPPQDSASSGDK